MRRRAALQRRPPGQHADEDGQVPRRVGEADPPAAARTQQRELFERYQRTHDDKTRQQLVEQYTNLVYFLARKFAGRGEPLEDVVQVGFLGLLQAIERFDPSRGLEFTTFATPTIVGEIKRYFRDKSWAVRIPRRLQELNQKSRIAGDELQQKLGRAPSVHELAEHLGVSEEEILEAYEAQPAKQTVSLDPVPPGGEEADTVSLGERLGVADENLARVELQDMLQGAMAHLNERERQILYLRFVDELPQSEVAKRLGISQMHVSRLQRAAVESLRKQLPSDLQT